MDTLCLPAVGAMDINHDRVLSSTEKAVIVTLLQRHKYYVDKLNETRRIIRLYRARLFDPPPAYSVVDPASLSASVAVDNDTVMPVFLETTNPAPLPSQPFVLPELGQLPPVAIQDDVDPLVLTRVDTALPVASHTDMTHPVAADINSPAIRVRDQQNTISSATTTGAEVAHEVRRVANYDGPSGRSVLIDTSITINGDGPVILLPRAFSSCQRTTTRPTLAVATAPSIAAGPDTNPPANSFITFARASAPRLKPVGDSAAATPAATLMNSSALTATWMGSVARRRSPRSKRELESDGDYVVTKRRKRSIE